MKNSSINHLYKLVKACFYNISITFQKLISQTDLLSGINKNCGKLVPTVTAFISQRPKK